VFLADGEVRRDILPLAPEPIGLPEATTRADGTFDLGAALQPGRYLVQLSYAGDLGHWPSRAEFELEGGD
jgi:hypothetical protein